VSVERKKHIDMVRYVDSATKLTLEEMANTVKNSAAALAPSDTGTMRNSISAEKVSNYEWKVGPDNLEYPIYVEFGTGDQGAGGGRKWTYWSDKLQQFVTTSGMAAQPFLRPALDSIRNKAAKIWRVVSGRFARR